MARLLLALLVLVPAIAGAKSPRALLQEGHVRVRVSTEPARQVLIGQQTRFFVEILTDTWFTEAPAYPELTIEGAVALMPEQLGTNFTERIEGETFAAQRRSYVIFPQRAGVLEIPSLRIRLGVSQDGKAGTPFTLRTRPLRLNVVLPAEAEGVEGLVTTPRLRVREEWSRPLEDLRVGDAVERSIRIEAERALGMLLPDLDFDAPSGIAVYPDQARIEDSVNRGQYRGERVESVTYVLQRQGEFTVPAIELHWWNPAWSSLQTKTLEARTFEVTGAASPADSGVAPPDPWEQWRARIERALATLWEHRLSLLLAAVALVALVPLLRRVVPRVRARLASARLRRRGSELAAFRGLLRSSRQGDLEAVVRDYWRWRDLLVQEHPRLSAHRLTRAAETSGFAGLWLDLQRTRYGRTASRVSTRELRAALPPFRAALLAESGREAPSVGLSGLNPGSASETGS